MVDADLTLRIEHSSGDVSELVVPTPTAIDEEAVTLSTIELEDALDRVARCEAIVFRDSWLDVLDEVDRRDDELYVDDDDGTSVFGGRLDDWQFDGTTVSVQIDSFERDAKDAEPPAEFSREGEPDDAIAEAILDLVPGPVEPADFPDFEETTSSIDYSARHTSPASMLRELTSSTDAEIEYRPDGSVAYLERRGEDREEVLTPTDGIVVTEPRIRANIREEVTNVRAVSREDRELYEEAVASETDGREVWDVDEVDSTSSSRLQARATTIANEYAEAPEYLEVETTLDVGAMDTFPSVGDRYPVELPAYGVDDELRVIEADRTIGTAGDLVDVLLSNRKHTLAGR